MVNKIIVHDLKKYFFKILYASLGLIAVTIIFYFVMKMPKDIQRQSSYSILASALTTIFFGLLIFTLIIFFGAMYQIMYSSLYSKEGYITHSIPVSTSKLYIAKILTAFILLLYMTIILIIVIYVMVNGLFGDSFFEMLSYFFTSKDTIIYVFMVLTYIIYYLALVGFVLVLLNILKVKKYKVIVVIILYEVVTNVITLISQLPLIIMTSSSYELPGNLALYIQSGVTLLFGLGIVWLSCYLLNKKLSLD
ncbi:MAG: hypothetical protein LBM99_01360 [Bacillales bacterium]|jgi:hypothetical protein|nr:hypothetical protein [Bacillales bacterium]